MLVRPGTPADIPGLMRLTESMYEYRWSEAFYRWQYFENVHPTVLLVAESQGELVGTFGIQQRLVNRTIRCGQVCWINIHPSHQGRGLFRRMGQEAIAAAGDLDALCVFANDAGAPACDKALGMPVIGDCERLLLASQTFAHQAPGFRVEVIGARTRFGSPLEAPGDRLVFDHSAPYRLWRYAANPARSYELVRVDDDAYAVVKLFHDRKNDTTYGDIVDLEADLADVRALRAVMAAASAHLIQKGCAQVTTWATAGSPLRTSVDELGFRSGGHSSHFCVRVMDPAHPALTQIAAWHLVQADASNY